LFSSFSDLECRCLLQLVLLRRRSEAFKELEIIVVRHEFSVPRQSRRPQFTAGGSSVGCLDSRA
jgi:hypothetical protein